MSDPKEIFDNVQSRISANNAAQFDALLESPENLCICTQCGWPGTGSDFTVSTGGGDYEGQCPRCYAPEKHVLDLRD